MNLSQQQELYVKLDILITFIFLKKLSMHLINIYYEVIKMDSVRITIRQENE